MRSCREHFARCGRVDESSRNQCRGIQLRRAESDAIGNWSGRRPRDIRRLRTHFAGQSLIEVPFAIRAPHICRAFVGARFRFTSVTFILLTGCAEALQLLFVRLRKVCAVYVVHWRGRRWCFFLRRGNYSGGGRAGLCRLNRGSVRLTRIGLRDARTGDGVLLTRQQCSRRDGRRFLGAGNLC